MSHMNMAVVNGGSGGMPMMNNGANGATPRPGNEEDEPDYEARLNTYIYDYFLKHQQYNCARTILNSGMPLKTSPKGDVNGADDMHTDSKDDLDAKKPDDLPPAGVPQDPQGQSFLLEWFGLFWDVFFAHQRKAPPGSAAMQYVAHTQQQSRLRQEQQQNILRMGPGMMAGGMNGMNDYQQMMFRQQNGMQMNDNLRKNALQNQNRNYSQNQMMAMKQQQQQHLMQTMRRDPSDIDMNGQRPRTPSSGDNAPSPSKRPRIEGHPGMMLQNGRPQQMLDQSNNATASILMQGGINPASLSDSQYMTFQQQIPQVQQKSIQVYAQNLRQNQQRQSMSKQPGMPNQGSPMMQAGMDLAAVGPEFYGPGMQMRPGMANGNGPGAHGNHALQDYQMQLMLLEQQNKKRLLMARQEQDTLPRPDGQPGMPGGPFPPGMSPSGSRSGPSPGPNDQMKRGTPKMGQAGLPSSPMPNDASMPQNRASPAASMNFNNGMPSDMFMKMGEGVAAMGPNGPMMRQPPSSHPNFNPQLNQQQMAEMQRAQAARGMPNGNWQQAPQGQAPMMQHPPPPQGQQPSQMGTPQQRGAMPPPPQVLPAGAVNGRPGSPAQPAAPPTPSSTNKPNPKPKKDAKDRKKPTKKNSTAGAVAAATPSTEAENTAPTPTPSTPITPQHAQSFNNNNSSGTKHDAQTQNAAGQNPPSAAPAVEQPQPEMASMDGFGLGENTDGQYDLTFGDFTSNNHLEGFDFDSFLQDGALAGLDPEAFTFDNANDVEAVGN